MARHFRIFSLLSFVLSAMVLSPISVGLAGEASDRIKASGKLVVATDPGWPPFSSRDADGNWIGFDVDVATEIAKRMGAKAEFVAPPWDEQVAGHWKGKWDACVCSMTPTVERAKNLDFPANYYWAPVNLAVNAKNLAAKVPANLSGKRIGFLVPSTYELYLRGEPMGIDGMQPVTHMIDNAIIVPYDSDSASFDGVAKGEIDATMNYLPVLMYEIKQGRPMRIIGTPLFYVSDAVAIDKGDPELSALIKNNVEGMIADGTIGALSMKWFQFDLSKAP